MPSVTIYTNKKNADITEGAELRIATAIAEVLSKPIEMMIVLIFSDLRLLKNGTTDPACIVGINAIATFDKEKNPTFTPGIKKAIQDELSGVPEDRIVLVYGDVNPDFLG